MLPTLSNRLDSVVRLTPQASGMSIGGQDNRMNNITVDGSYFNNSFGLGGQPGDRTGVAPISLEAIEQVRSTSPRSTCGRATSSAPASTRVTRSGTNKFAASGYYQFRDESLVGHRGQGPGGQPRHVHVPQHRRVGVGPIIRNKLFFFANYEDEEDVRAGHDVPRQHGRRAGRRQHDPRAGVGPGRPEPFLRSQIQVRHRAVPGLSTT